MLQIYVLLGHNNTIPWYNTSLGGEAISNIGFGNGTGPILASNISCNGGEYTLGNCYNTTDIPDVCTHERDAAASCQPAFSELQFPS